MSLKVTIVSNRNCIVSLSGVCRFKYYERWASAHEFPFQNIINDGSTTVDNRWGGELCNIMLELAQ